MGHVYVPDARRWSVVLTTVVTMRSGMRESAERRRELRIVRAPVRERIELCVGRLPNRLPRAEHDVRVAMHQCHLRPE